ncbi:hypothetical protein EDC01DRAFT_423527 [Geopyxis carbonaria]|nr:hypothetical protein EDC01DRAFT_423527 [Geopyxis carbonaria]
MVALPIIKSLEEATSLETVLYPFLHQFSYSHVEPLIYGKVSPTEWYLSTNPFITAALFCGVISVLCFIAQEITRNSSQVDRLWSILPTVYIAHYTVFAHMKGLETTRLDTMVTFFILWSARLTYNFWRKGGYQKGHEDYRHEILLNYMKQPLYTIWGFVFLAVYQNILLFLIAAPAYVFVLMGSMKSYPAWLPLDTVFSQGLVVLLVLETLSDQQQWGFQSAKKIYKDTGKVPIGYTAEDLDRGFVVTGLWSWSRHPNFACEQLIWVGMYQWTASTSNVMWHWAGVGAALLVLLFQGSALFSESISSKKYPEYKEYQTHVNRFLPGLKSFKGFQQAMVPEPKQEAKKTK